MQQTVFKREYSVLFHAVKTENVQDLEAKLPKPKLTFKKIAIEKISKNLNFKISR